MYMDFKMICFLSKVLLNLNDYRECLVRKKLQEKKVKGFLSFEFFVVCGMHNVLN